MGKETTFGNTENKKMVVFILHHYKNSTFWKMWILMKY